MNGVDKINTFKKELEFVKNPQIKLFAEKAIESLPDYFFTIPASSTGKYHPSYALGDGGLVRHTIAAVRIAIELFRTGLWKFTDDHKDLILVGLILHDGFKSGSPQEKYSKTDHPKIVSYEISHNESLKGLIPQEQMDYLLSNIATHMGRWVFDYKTKEKVLEEPKTPSQIFTHLADYLASRKQLEFNFDVEISKEDEPKA
jgi:hypothetical protein